MLYIFRLLNRWESHTNTLNHWSKWEFSGKIYMLGNKSINFMYFPPLFLCIEQAFFSVFRGFKPKKHLSASFILFFSFENYSEHTKTFCSRCLLLVFRIKMYFFLFLVSFYSQKFCLLVDIIGWILCVCLIVKENTKYVSI
jgi:hypothetical protein